MDAQVSIEAPLAERYLAVRERTCQLASPLSPEDCQIQSMANASPVKWHLAHTTWFWETFVLKPYAPDYQTPDDEFEFLFNSYYEAVGPRHDRPRRGMITRPSLDAVWSYRRLVDDAMQALIDIGGDVFRDLILLGLAHEEQHQELILTDIKHALFQNPTAPAAYDPIKRAHSPPSEQWIAFDGGLIELGYEGPGFHFDNEGPRHRTWLEPFVLAAGVVTNQTVQQFIEDGGYETPSLWLSDGWSCVQTRAWCAPLYWENRDGEWYAFTLSGKQKLVSYAPAQHLSFYEAAAIAEWAGCRLPTEAEWEHAALMGSEAFSDLFGEVWQWTRSDYAPYSGYQTPQGAIGEYNGKFMSGQYVLRGSSVATAPYHSRISYRNFFPADTRWQFSGLRLAKAP